MIKKYFKRIFLFFVCLFSIGIFTNLRTKAADYTNADAGHFIIYADGSISAEFTVSENNLSMKGWLLCLFTSEPSYGTDNKLTGSNNLHPYSVSGCAHYFFVTSTQKEGKFNIFWNALSNDQKKNWSADGLVESEKKLSDYILDDTDWHIVIGPRHFNDSWASEGIGAGDDGYWENCDIYIGQKSAIINFVTSTMDLIDGIGTVTYTNEIKIKIKNARHAYDALNDNDKALVTNYATLTAAEDAYYNLQKDNAEAKIAYVEEDVTTYKYFDTLIEAYDGAEDKETIILNKDVDISSRGTEYIVIEKNVSFDLNGHIFKTTALEGINNALKAKGNVVVTIDNTVPETGGFIGVCAIPAEDESYVLLRNVRLAISTDTIYSKEGFAKLNKIDTGFIAVAIESDPNGFLSLVRPSTKDDAISLISEIGEVEYNAESKAKIDFVRTIYEGLTDEAKALVTNYETLTQAEATYQGYVDQDEASQVDALIDAIGEVTYTFESEDKIDDAREAYDLLTDTQKTLVTKYETLTTAEATYQGFVDEDEASQVDALIDAIGEVTYDAESEEKIEDAREAYDLLTDTQKTLVTKYSTLTQAEATYQGYVDQDEASQVDALIDAIGEVTYDAESEEKIENAREAYDLLTEDQKALVTKYSTLTASESLYSKLEEDHNKADEVIGLINAIGNVYFNDETKAKIDSARASYNLLTEDQKALVTNYDTLTHSEKVYQGFVDEDKAFDVDAIIDSIGDVEYTESCKNIIEASRKAYDALTATQKALVTKYSTLTAAEATYAILKDNHEKADAVIALINAIGEVTYADAAKAKIDSARAAYDLLTDTQKALVTNYATLIAAESFYSKLKDDHEKAAATDALIDAIGDVSFSESCEEKLIAARASYNLLTEDQKALVSKIDDLEAKEEIYDNVSVVIESINSIGDVKYTAESKAKIDDANNLYNELTKEEKALVNNNDKLTKAIKTYDDVKTVVEKINAIGEVKYAAGSKEEIDAARASYESLTKEEKALIPNYNKLEENESTYNRLEKDHKLFVGWMIALGVVLGVIVVLVIVYLLLFFVFNKWMISNKKAIRVFRIGKKNEKIRVLKMNLIVKYTDENELHNSKNDALGIKK